MAEGEQTVASAGAGSFADFYRAELAGQVRRAALLLGSEDEGNDIVHDAMIGVCRRWGELDNPGGYLNRAVLNGCRDAGRRAATHRRLLPRLVDHAPTPPADSDLVELLAALPFNQRASIVLRFYCGMSTAEIADELGCAPGSVGAWISRALEQLRRSYP
jgi:RNA polymerase sigma factor (sigma-70 family)